MFACSMIGTLLLLHLGGWWGVAYRFGYALFFLFSWFLMDWLSLSQYGFLFVTIYLLCVMFGLCHVIWGFVLFWFVLVVLVVRLLYL